MTQIQRRHGTTILFIALVFVAYVLTLFIQAPASTIPREIPPDKGFSDAQKTAITVLVEMNKLVISLALLVIGAAGAIALNPADKIGAFRWGDRFSLVTSIVANAFSLYFGFELYFRMVEMLGQSGFVVDAPILRLAQKEQYYTFLVGVLALAITVVRRLETGGGDDDEGMDDDDSDGFSSP